MQHKQKSYVIGDHPSDIEMGYKAEVKSAYLLTEHGQKHLEDLKVKPRLIAKNIYEAALLIDKEFKNQ